VHTLLLPSVTRNNTGNTRQRKAGEHKDAHAITRLNVERQCRLERRRRERQGVDGDHVLANASHNRHARTSCRARDLASFLTASRRVLAAEVAPVTIGVRHYNTKRTHGEVTVIEKRAASADSSYLQDNGHMCAHMCNEG